MTQRVLITAGAGGIGLAIAKAFKARGAKVFVCDIDEAALAAATQLGLIAARCDMAQRTEIERMVPAALAALGGLDVLVNNAGISGPTAPTEQLSPDDWDKVLAVNITSMFDVTRLSIPALKQSKAGVIINLSSMAGRFGFANRSPYAVSKWGVIGFTKTLSVELGPFNIRVNAIAPGAVEGERLERVFAGRAKISGRSIADVRAQAMANQSIAATVSHEDIAALAVYLASDAAKAISGQMIPIDNDRQRA